jgi:hypothetical protein
MPNGRLLPFVLLQLASFMQELESSGLLADADADVVVDAPDAAVMPQQQTGSAAAAATGALDTSSTPQQELCRQGDQAATANTTDQPAQPAQGAQEEVEQQAEQRTLGLLAGAVEWAKVLDTGSDSIYYWHTVTNEVLWDPPAGVDGNALVPVEASQQADDHHAQKQAAEASAAQPQQVQAGAEPDEAATTDQQPSAEAVTSDQQEQEEDQQQQPPVLPGAGSQQQHCGETSVTVKEAAAACQPSNLAAESSLDSAQLDAEPGAAAAAMSPVLEEVESRTAVPAAAGGVSPGSQPTRPPQSDVHTVFMTLLTELQSPPAVQQALRQLPEAVKLVLQLQLLHQQWQTLAGQQQAAVETGQQVGGLNWITYELHVMQQLQQYVQRLQPAVQELEQQQKAQSQGPHPPGRVDNSGAAAAAGAAPSAATAAGADSAGADGSLQKQLLDEEAEEGEVAGSADSGSEDMDLDLTPRTAAPPQLQADSQHQQHLGGQPRQQVAEAAAGQAAHWGWPAGGPYTAAGTYTSTMHMPEWARPRDHYEFHAARSSASYNDYMYAGYDAAGYAAAAAYAMDSFHQGAARPGYVVPASYIRYVDAATTSPDTAGPTPPLPEEEPPPLPDEQLPADDVAPAPLLLDSSTQEAGVVGAQQAASAAKRRQYVSQPVITSVAANSKIEGVDLQLQGATGATPETVGVASAGAAMSTASTYTGAATLADVAIRKRAREKEGRGAALAAAPAAKVAKAAKVSKLISKWASVRQQQEEEELERQRKEQEAADPDLQEQKRLQQLEHWRLQQVQSGAADSNPNFVPLTGDWRAKLGLGGAGGSGNAAAGEGATAEAARKVARKAAKAAKATKAAKAEAASTKAALWPTNSKTKPDLGALSVGLPSGWQAMWDAKSGDIYYGNPTTKVGKQVLNSGAVRGQPCNSQVPLQHSGAWHRSMAQVDLMMRWQPGVPLSTKLLIVWW